MDGVGWTPSDAEFEAATDELLGELTLDQIRSTDGVEVALREGWNNEIIEKAEEAFCTEHGISEEVFEVAERLRNKGYTIPELQAALEESLGAPYPWTSTYEALARDVWAKLVSGEADPVDFL